MRTLALSLALLSSAAAQPPGTTWPNALAGCFTNSTNAFPFARTGGLFQLVHGAPFLDGPRVITHTGARVGLNVNSSAATLTLEVLMANTPVTPLAMTGDFVANRNAGGTVVFTRKLANLAAVSSMQDPNLTPVWLVHDVPFVATGTNLLVQFDLGPAASATNLTHRTDGLYQTGGDTFHANSRPDCGGSATASYTTGTWNVTVTGAQPSQPVMLLVGGSNTRFGTTSLPLALDFIGLVNCNLRVDPLIMVGGLADAAGSRALNVPLALPPSTVALHAQALHRSSSHPSGWALTNAATSLLGHGMANYVYNWTIDGPLAQYGPYPVNSSLSLLFRP